MNCSASNCFLKERETVIWENERSRKKGKCFPFFIKRKTLSSDKVTFSVLTGIKFSLTSFPYCYQTWKNEENEFQELVFLETNATLISILQFFYWVIVWN
jgi:hypothetical protein